ncbi:cupin domain-containing protein [Vibrio kyushuensis]|uniref:cupin domain-containing protein n=1 Tax=Vibrio TaxID=662 RepID=UPI003D145FE5
MKETTITNNIVSSLVASLFILTTIISFSSAAGEEYVPKKATMQKLHQAPLPGVDGKEMTVVHLAAPAGFISSKHTHPGPVYVYVLEGELTIELENETKTFKAGELYPEEIDSAMIGKNSSSTDDLELLIFQVGDIGKPMMIKVE